MLDELLQCVLGKDPGRTGARTALRSAIIIVVTSFISGVFFTLLLWRLLYGE